MAWHSLSPAARRRRGSKLRYSPRDVAIAALIRRLLAAGDETALTEDALRILYQCKAFREETRMDEEHYPEGKPPPPPPRHGGPPHGPARESPGSQVRAGREPSRCRL